MVYSPTKSFTQYRKAPTRTADMTVEDLSIDDEEEEIPRGRPIKPIHTTPVASSTVEKGATIDITTAMVWREDLPINSTI